MVNLKATRFPFEVKELEQEEKAEIARLYQRNIDYVRLEPSGFIVMRRFLLDAANIYNMEVRPDDIFVITYQRSGTTLTQELVWLLANNLDFDTAKEVPVPFRYPFLDIFMLFDEQWQQDILKTYANKDEAQKLFEVTSIPQSSKLTAVPSPRFIKGHLPLCLMPPTLLDTGKVVYVARDPRDVAVSCYHHAKLFKVLEFPSSFKDFWSLFIKDLFILTPFFTHLKQSWEKRDHPNMLFLFYEDLVQNMPGTIRRVADFLGKQVSDIDVDRLCEHLKVDNFKKNKAVNFEHARDTGLLASGETFVRKGKAGGWREYFDDEMTQQAEQWMADNLRDTDLRFPDVLHAS